MGSHASPRLIFRHLDLLPPALLVVSPSALPSILREPSTPLATSVLLSTKPFPLVRSLMMEPSVILSLEQSSASKLEKLSPGAHQVLGLVGGIFDPVGVPTYPVKAKGKVVEVQVDVNYKANFEADYWTGVLDAQGKASGKYY